jgi:long-chain acyl-CoA synthetase
VPTMAEIRQMLTGPGGTFEVVDGLVDGVSMKLYRDRLPSLRSVAELAAGRGDQTFLVHGARRLSYAEFFAAVNSTSEQLTSRFGIEHGDRVAVLSANNPEWCTSFWGTVNVGAILVGLNGWWKTDEILYGLQDSGSKVLVTDRGRFTRIAEQLDLLPDLEAVFIVDADPSEFGDDPRLHRFAELTSEPATTAFPSVEISEADYAVIFYTSGTTGRPKGAISSHRNMIANLQNTIYNTVATAMLNEDAPPVGGTSQTTALLTSPLFHVSGCHSSLVVGTLGGVKLVIPEGKFEPEKALRLIQDEAVTIWATVPTMVWRVCEYPGRDAYDTSTVTTVAFGGSPSAEELQRKVRDTFPNVRSTSNAYGLTETSSVATVISGHDALAKPESVGPPVPVVELRIVDSSGRDVGAGQPGEVWIKGPIVMPGYWGKPDATGEALTDGWLRSGDIGYLDDDGYLFITDRAKDMIIRGGENIYCVEIEQRLVLHPDIADAAVLGVAHAELGEEVKAVIEVRPGVELTDDEVRSWVAAVLADFKVPRYVEFTTEKLPRNASGKLLKNVLRGDGHVSFAETM